MANTHLAYPDLALDKLSGTDPDQEAEAFIRLVECKINFAHATETRRGGCRTCYQSIQKESLIFLATTRTSS